MSKYFKKNHNIYKEFMAKSNCIKIQIISSLTYIPSIFCLMFTPFHPPPLKTSQAYNTNHGWAIYKIHKVNYSFSSILENWTILTNWPKIHYYIFLTMRNFGKLFRKRLICYVSNKNLSWICLIRIQILVNRAQSWLFCFFCNVLELWKNSDFLQNCLQDPCINFRNNRIWRNHFWYT